MMQHVICRSLSVACALVGKGVGGGRGAAFHTRWVGGGGAADQRSMILVKTTSKGSKGN